MRVFITGTDTNIGKTLISSWLCLHTAYSYFKPIQTGSIEGTDSLTVSRLSGVDVNTQSESRRRVGERVFEERSLHLVGEHRRIRCSTTPGLDSQRVYPESYVYKAPLSPHLASLLEGEEIDLSKIELPKCDRLVIEGAGGVLVPINRQYLMIDLIEKFQIPVIIVASTKLGTINHTLLSIEALRSRNIEILGVIMNGELNDGSSQAIEHYGKVKILAQVPLIDPTALGIESIPLTEELRKIFKV